MNILITYLSNTQEKPVSERLVIIARLWYKGHILHTHLKSTKCSFKTLTSPLLAFKEVIKDASINDFISSPREVQMKLTKSIQQTSYSNPASLNNTAS